MFKSILHVSRPILLLMTALTYSLGAGISHYLGKPIRLAIFGLGGLAVLAMICSASLFVEYFRLPFLPLVQEETPRKREKYQVILLQVSYASLTLSFVAILTLLLNNSLNLAAVVIIVIAFLLLIAYAIPPLRLSESGYGELTLAITIGTLVPAIAFLVQYGKLHRLLSLTTFPLTLLAIAYMLISNFPSFATDLKLERHTLLTRLTWPRAIPVHHFLIFGAFILFAAAPFLGYPWNLVWPVFLAFPFAAIQMIWLQRIATGGRTLWNFLTALAAATFCLTAYLLAFTYWIR
jgi:1,4-dihydroxy-2-naphthoate octaprenyltransferase